jgi:metal-responsive CopG/Arc/MetJ family transcriptional regulator
MPQAKVKLSITLSRDLVALIDRRVSEQHGASRSGLIESWLRQAAGRDAEAALARETVAYYERLTGAERTEDDEWARFSAGELARRDAPRSRGRRWRP